MSAVQTILLLALLSGVHDGQSYRFTNFHIDGAARSKVLQSPYNASTNVSMLGLHDVEEDGSKLEAKAAKHKVPFGDTSVECTVGSPEEALVGWDKDFLPPEVKARFMNIVVNPSEPDVILDDIETPEDQLDKGYKREFGHHGKFQVLVSPSEDMTNFLSGVWLPPFIEKQKAAAANRTEGVEYGNLKWSDWRDGPEAGSKVCNMAGDSFLPAEVKKQLGRLSSTIVRKMIGIGKYPGAPDNFIKHETYLLDRDQAGNPRVINEMVMEGGPQEMNCFVMQFKWTLQHDEERRREDTDGVIRNQLDFKQNADPNGLPADQIKSTWKGLKKVYWLHATAAAIEITLAKAASKTAGGKEWRPIVKEKAVEGMHKQLPEQAHMLSDALTAALS